MRASVLFSVLLFSICGYSQDSLNVNFDSFEIPNSPAFILLDEAPTTIQRPNSTRAFALDLLQDVQDDGVLENIAVEVTPFWLIKHKSMNPQKFYGIREAADGKAEGYNPFAKLKLASISAAYVNSGDSIVNFSLGVRTTLIEIKRKEDIQAYKDALSETQRFLSNTADYNEEFTSTCKIPKPENYDTVEEFKSSMEEFLQVCKKPESGDFNSAEEFRNANDKYRKNCLCMEPRRDDYATEFEYKSALDSFRNARNEFITAKEKEAGFDLDQFDQRFQEIINRKPILAIDLAAAYNHRFFSGTFNDNGAGRLGVWSTFTLSSYLSQNNKTDYLNIYAFFRYLNETNRGMVPIGMDDRFNAFDIGVKGELEFNKLAVGYEYINRTGDMEGYRSAGTIKYKLLNDVYLTGSFGNNFAETDDLISLFGIKWGVNSKLQSMDVTSSE